MNEDEQRRMLGGFIRAKREAMEPAGVARRRTPGLRREELAQRAGISATWCTWLEQGREVRASPQALARLARALDLTRAERSYLFELAGRHDPDSPASAPSGEAPASLAAAVASLACPAYGLDPLWNACCWNAAAAQVFPGWLDRNEQPSLLRFIFLDPRAKALIPDWEMRARRIVAEFRVDYGHALRDAAMTELVDTLAARSPLFAESWNRQAVLGREGGMRTLMGQSGEVRRYTQHTFAPADTPGYKLVMLVSLE